MPVKIFAPALALALLVSPFALAGEHSAFPGDCIVVARGDGGSPVIEARINGAGPFAFVLDTGSSGTTLDDSRIKQLGLVPDRASEQAAGMGGVVDVDLFRLRSFESGPLVARDLIVPGLAAPSFGSHDITGLAGVDLFGRTLAIWDLGWSCIRLAPAGSRPAGRGWRSPVSKWLKPWKVLLPVRIGNAAGWGLLDTGAQKTIVSPGFARAAQLDAAIVKGRSTISGVDGRATPLLEYEVANARVGTWRFGRATVSVAALPVFDRLGGMDEAVAVIGMDWIADKPFALDYGRQKMWQKSTAAKAARDR